MNNENEIGSLKHRMVVMGFMVAYAAMFGFDKLRQVMNWGDKK